MDVKQHNIFICVIFRTLSNMLSKLSLFDTIYSWNDVINGPHMFFELKFIFQQLYRWAALS